MTFKQQHSDAVIEAAAARKAEGAPLRDLEAEFGIPRSALSRRIAAYEAERLTAVPTTTAAQRQAPSQRPEDAPNQEPAPPAAVAIEQARREADERARLRDAGKPVTRLWHDAEKFPPYGFALAFDLDQRLSLLQHRATVEQTLDSASTRACGRVVATKRRERGCSRASALRPASARRAARCSASSATTTPSRPS